MASSPGMVKFSLVICSRNRAAKLAAMLEKLALDDLTRSAVEVNLVDSASTDSTQDVMRAYKDKSGLPVNVGRADRPGLSVARNAGINISTGEVIVFTDDDCYIDPNFFTALSELWEGNSFQFGGGQILPFNPDDDPTSANMRVQQRVNIPVRNFLPAGLVQGANMFFTREVFRCAGFFNENMGAGTPFSCEDIEMATRASLQGFSGALLPELIVLHDHGRKRGSVEAERTRKDYDFGRGAYYASFILAGHPQIWELWARQSHGRGSSAPDLVRLAREMDGARAYLEFMANNTGRISGR
jgi:glycosyltransferase involved in cell wall biosynthesis